MRKRDLKVRSSKPGGLGASDKDATDNFLPSCSDNFSTKSPDLVNPVSPSFNNPTNSFNQINPGLPSFTDAAGFYRAGTAGAWHAWVNLDPVELELAGSVLIKAANAIRASGGSNG